ncbi:MAG: hypothetical protein RMJ48_06030 [Roseiflexaceae bacterium]|nr:hypothetical protein [Roseiflexaceae bacterium]
MVADKPAPDAPILLVTNPKAQPSFGAYLGAILRAEGFVAFRVARLDAINAALLAQFPLVLLAAGPLTAEAADLFRAYVLNGGHLIAFRPDPRLADLMGVRVLGGEVTNGLLLVADHPLARGIVTRALQVHTPAAQYELAGAEPVAWIARRDGSPTSYPAVTVARAGKGVAALWSFDLPQNIALIRQGNPAAANQERDGLDGIRTTDLFVDWIDPDVIDVPQADEQQRLLANMVHALADALPLPRLWYLPAGAAAVLVATGDAHGIWAHHITPGIEIVERYGGTISVYYTTPAVSAQRRTVRRIQWWGETLPIIGHIFEERSGYPTPRLVEQWRERGHGFGLHPWVEKGVARGYNHAWNDFVKHGYGPAAPTVRTHRVLWSGWVDTAKVQAQYGIRMNLDYYHVGSVTRRPNGGYLEGYLVGSGLPLPFVDEQGNVLRVYQQHTHIVDEHQIAAFDHGYEMNLSVADAVALSRRQIDCAVERFPSALGLQSHFDPYAFSPEKAALERNWLDGILSHAAARGVAIMSAEQWLAFTEMRNQAEMRSLTWNETEGMLAFEAIVGAESQHALLLLLPLKHRQRFLRQVTIDGVLANTEQKRAGGVAYGAVALAAGRRQVRAYYG